MLTVQWPPRWTRGVVALAVLLSSSALAHAQGCAMCYTSAAAAKASAIQALRSGILILLLPALAMFAGIFVVIYRSRNRFNGVVEWTAEHDRDGREMLIRMDRVDVPEPRERILPSVVSRIGTPSPPAPLPQGGEGRLSPTSTPSRPRERGDGGEGVVQRPMQW